MSGNAAASGHSYSVRQVETVFASQGIALHQGKTAHGVVTLAGAGVKVLVTDGQSFPMGWTGEKPISQRNLIVFRPKADKDAVNSALRDLQ